VDTNTHTTYADTLRNARAALELADQVLSRLWTGWE